MLEEKVKVKIGLLCMAIGMFCFIFKCYKPEFALDQAINFILTVGGVMIGTHWTTDLASITKGLQNYGSVGESESQIDKKESPKI